MVLDNINNCQGPSVILPYNELITSTEEGQIPLLPALSTEAKTAMISPQLAGSSLISLGQLCDTNCAILLNNKQLVAFKDNKMVLKGLRNPHDRL